MSEGQRQFSICNACRYCEGYCAVFPAMEERIDFSTGDLAYLSNICHDCRACYQACMYTEPHEFGVNIPRLMAESREATYVQYSQPQVLARMFDRGPVGVVVLMAGSIALVTALYLLLSDTADLFATSSGPGAFYDVVPHLLMAGPALLLTAFGGIVATTGFVMFLRDSGASRRALSPWVWTQALSEIARLRWLDGGGGGCFYPEAERPSPTRRWAHHLVAYGFLLSFASTVSAAFYEYVLAEKSPFPFLTVPVLLGTAGGIALTLGCIEFLRMNRRRDGRLDGGRTPSLDTAFLIVLLLVSVTGLALLAVQKATGVVHVVLLIHLGTVVAFFVTAPYGKFMHAVYRLAGVIRSVEERQEAEARVSRRGSS